MAKNNKEIIKIGKTTRILLAVLGLLVALTFIFVSWGKVFWTQYVALVSSAFLGLVLLSEAAMFEYFRKKDYEEIGFGDVVVWVTFGVGILMIMSFVLLLQIIQKTAPQWLITFMAGYGTVIGIFAGLLFVYHMFTPRPK